MAMEASMESSSSEASSAGMLLLPLLFDLAAAALFLFWQTVKKVFSDSPWKSSSSLEICKMLPQMSSHLCTRIDRVSPVLPPPPLMKRMMRLSPWFHRQRDPWDCSSPRSRLRPRTTGRPSPPRPRRMGVRKASSLWRAKKCCD